MDPLSGRVCFPAPPSHPAPSAPAAALATAALAAPAGVRRRLRAAIEVLLRRVAKVALAPPPVWNDGALSSQAVQRARLHEEGCVWVGWGWGVGWAGGWVRGGAAGRAGFGRWRAQRHLRREVVEAARGLDVGVEVGLVHLMARRGAALVEMVARVLAGAIGEAVDVHLIAHLLREHDRRQPRRWHLRTHHACTHVCMERTRYR